MLFSADLVSSFVRCLREFVRPPPNHEAFEEFLLSELPRLSNDIVDVRLALAQLVADLFVIGESFQAVARLTLSGSMYHERRTELPPAIVHLAETLSQDDAVDVRDTVRHINLAFIGKGKTVPYAADADHPLNHATTRSSDPDLSEPGGFHRRPSEDVSNRLGSMFLAPSDPEENEPTPTPTPVPDSPDVYPKAANPFAMEFADATPDE